MYERVKGKSECLEIVKIKKIIFKKKNNYNDFISMSSQKS